MPSMQVETGVLTLTMANGETVETASLTINAPEACYIPELPGEDAELKGGEVWMVEVVNGDKLTGVQVDGQDVDFIINGSKLYINVPQMANASSMVKLISSNGEIEYAVAFIPATEIKNSVWSGMVQLSWGVGGRVIIPASAFENVPAGARMVLCYEQVDQQWDQAQINYADWSGVNFTEGDIKVNQTLVPTDVYGWTFDKRETTLVLTQEILDNIQAKKGDIDDENAKGVGILIQGSGLIFTQIRLEWEISLNTYIWKGTCGPTNWAGDCIVPIGAEEAALLKAGKTMGFDFYCDPSAGWWQVSYKGTWWTDLPTLSDNGGQKIWEYTQDQTNFEYTMTQGDIDIMVQQGGLLFCGNGVVITGVYVR